MADDTTRTEVLPKGLTEAEVEAKFRQLLKDKAEDDPATLARSLLKLTLRLRGQLEDAAKKAVPRDHVVITRAEADTLAAYKAIGTVEDMTKTQKTIEAYAALGSPEDLKKSAASLTAYAALGSPEDLKKSAASLSEYQMLGDIKAIKEVKEELPKVKGTLAAQEREKELAEVEKAAGYKGDVFRKLATPGLVFVPTRLKVKGKSGIEREVDTFIVQDKDAEGNERSRPLSAWEESAEVKPFLPALKPAAVAETARPRNILPIGGTGFRGNDTGQAPPRRAAEETPAERPNLAASF